MMILLTGGSACGKSHYAESLCLRIEEPRYYIDAMRPNEDGGDDKLARCNRPRTGEGFKIIERCTDLAGLVLPERGTALLECICNLTANEMFDERGAQTDPCDAVLLGVDTLSRQCDTLVVVTNDVGSDNKAYSAGTRAYVRALGRINAALAGKADAVYEMVCGIPVVIKGELL